MQNIERSIPTEIEELADKLKIDVQQVFDLTTHYGSVSNFIQMYRDGKLSEDEIALYNNNLINNLIDSDCNPLAENYSALLKACLDDIFYSKHDFYMFSSEGLEKALKTVTPREEEIMKLRYGLIDGKCEGIGNVGKHLNIPMERVRQIEARCLRKLRHPSRLQLFKPTSITELKENQYVSDEERNALTDLENDILNSNLIFRHGSIDDVDFDKNKFGIIRNIQGKINLRERDTKEDEKEEQSEDIGNINISEMGCLESFKIRRLNRMGIITIADLSSLTKEDIKKKLNLDKNSAELLITTLEELGIVLPESNETRIKDDFGPDDDMPIQGDMKAHSESEMAKIREKKTKLEAELKELEEQTKKAKELLAEYNKMLGDDELTTDTELPESKDE